MKAIVAMDPNRVIGYRGGIPWHYKEDMKWFKEFTMGKTLVMGYNTYKSLPAFLAGRQIVVLTREWHPSMAFNDDPKADRVYYRYPVGHQKPWVMEVFDPTEWDDVVVAGGAKTYMMLMPYITEMYVTHIADEYEGDTFMPEFEKQLPYMRIVRESKDFIIARHEKQDSEFIEACLDSENRRFMT